MLANLENSAVATGVEKISFHSSSKESFHFQFSFPFHYWRKVMPKEVQTVTQLHSFHTLAKYCSKFPKLGFSNMWTENLQMFKLVLEKAEEPVIKLPTSIGSSKKQENSRKTCTSPSLTMPKTLTVCITTNWKVLKELGIPEKTVARSRSNS